MRLRAGVISEGQIAKLASYGIPMIATIEVFDRYGRPVKRPRSSTRLERETVPQEALDAFYPVPEDFDVAVFQSWIDLTSRTLGPGSTTRDVSTGPA